MALHTLTREKRSFRPRTTARSKFGLGRTCSASSRSSTRALSGRLLLCPRVMSSHAVRTWWSVCGPATLSGWRLRPSGRHRGRWLNRRLLRPHRRALPLSPWRALSTSRRCPRRWARRTARSSASRMGAPSSPSPGTQGRGPGTRLAKSWGSSRRSAFTTATASSPAASTTLSLTLTWARHPACESSHTTRARTPWRSPSRSAHVSRSTSRTPTRSGSSLYRMLVRPLLKHLQRLRLPRVRPQCSRS
mmetsp:Transcript_54092/g.125813  ORF Transcript_54092/g.125813 Transcript_54092/m.125813 type:complete len:247 (-) Transcript_54092:907-1647(-)